MITSTLTCIVENPIMPGWANHCFYYADVIKWKHFPRPPVTGEFLSQRPVTRSFDVFFHLHLNKRLSKQTRGWWYETPSRSLWRRCNGLHMVYVASLGLLYTLQWRVMGFMASQITGNPTVCSAVIQAHIKEKSNQALHQGAFLREINRWPFFFHERPVMRKASPCHIVIMIEMIDETYHGGVFHLHVVKSQ